MLKRIYKYYKNFILFNIFKYLDILKIYFLPRRYSIRIERVIYVDDAYILNLHMRDQMQSVNLNIQQIFNNKILINTMSPLDAYICGVIYSLDKHGLIFNYTNHYLVNYFSSYNHGYAVGNVMKLIDISFYTGELKIKIGKYIRTMKYDEFIFNPFLLSGLSSDDAAKIGIISLDHVIDEICLN